MSDTASLQSTTPFQADFSDSLLNAEKPVPNCCMAADQDIAVQRFNVYRNNVFAGLIEALRDSFPVVERLVGQEFFAALAQAYRHDNMPSSPVMMQYGAKFPDFLRRFEPVASLPYLPDVAQLEWLYSEAFHSADFEPVSMETVLGAAQARLNEVILHCHPALRFLASDYAALSLWHAHKVDPEDNTIEMPVCDVAEEILLTRPALAVELRWLSKGSALFMEGLQQGKMLGDIIGDMARAYPDFDLEEMLSILFESGGIVGFHFAEEK